MTPSLFAISFSEVENLPSPPLWQGWLLEKPLPLLIVVASVGVVAMMLMTSQGESRKALKALLLTLLVGGAIFGLSRLVTTQREKVIQESRRFIDRVAIGDSPAVESMLAEEVVLRSGGEVVNRDRTWVVQVVQGLDKEIKSHSITERGVIINEPSGTAQSRLSVSTVFDPSTGVPGGRVGSSWDITWKRGGDQRWRITGIECISLFGQKPSREWVDWGERQRGR